VGCPTGIVTIVTSLFRWEATRRVFFPMPVMGPLRLTRRGPWRPRPAYGLRSAVPAEFVTHPPMKPQVRAVPGVAAAKAAW
jgi:hypothetical protein